MHFHIVTSVLLKLNVAAYRQLFNGDIRSHKQVQCTARKVRKDALSDVLDDCQLS